MIPRSIIPFPTHTALPPASHIFVLGGGKPANRGRQTFVDDTCIETGLSNKSDVTLQISAARELIA